MSRHQDIIAALKTLMGTITGITDVREWDTAQDDDEEEFVDIRDDEEIDIDKTGGPWIYTMPLSVTIQLSGTTSPADARSVVFGIFAALKTNQRLGGADKIDPVNYRLQTDQAGQRVSRIELRLVVTYTTDPFSED